MKVLISWPRFGPYHLARIKAAYGVFNSVGDELTALEIAGSDKTYLWDKITGDCGFKRITLFPDLVYEDIPDGVMSSKISQELDSLNPDILVVCGYRLPDSRCMIRWARENRKQIILMTETKGDDKFRLFPVEFLKKIYLKSIDAAFCGGSEHRRYLESLRVPYQQIFEKYDIVDNDYFFKESQSFQGKCDESLRSKLNIPNGPFFLASSRFIPRKNIDGLIMAFELYRKNHSSPWDLVILGDGPLMPELKKMIIDRGIKGVYLPGFRQIEELPAYYGLASVFIHPAHNEPWGLVVNEAMASGLPVLGTHATGAAADLVVDDVNGYRFNSRSVTQLSELMGKISSNSNRLIEMGKASLDIIKRFSPLDFGKNLYSASQFVFKRRVINSRKKSSLSVFHGTQSIIIGGKPIMTLPDSFLRLEDRSPYDFILGRSFKKRFLRTGLKMLHTLGMDCFFRQETNMSPYGDYPVKKIINEVVSPLLEKLKLPANGYFITYPATVKRGKVYVYLCDASGQVRYFIKIGFSNGSLKEMQNEADSIVSVAQLKNEGIFRAPRLFLVHLIGDFPFLCFDYEPLISNFNCLTWDKMPSLITSRLRMVGYRTVSLNQLDWITELKELHLSSSLRHFVDNYTDTQLDVCLCHGDFTAWNLFKVKGEIILCDWEYSSMNAPVLTDYLSFHLSLLIKTIVPQPSHGMEHLKHLMGYDIKDREFRKNIKMAILYLCTRGNSLARAIARYWEVERE